MFKHPDYKEIEAFLVGRCGLTQEQAGWTSWEEYLQRRDGKIQEERLEWEKCRWMKFIDLQLNPHIKKGQKPATPQKWFQFAWEKEAVKAKQPPKRLKTTQEEKEILQGIFDKLR